MPKNLNPTEILKVHMFPCEPGLKSRDAQGQELWSTAKSVQDRGRGLGLIGARPFRWCAIARSYLHPAS